MDLSVFGAVNVRSVMAQDLHRGSDADSGGAGFTGTLSECMKSDGSAALQALKNEAVQAGASKDSSDGAGVLSKRMKSDGSAALQALKNEAVQVDASKDSSDGADALSKRMKSDSVALQALKNEAGQVDASKDSPDGADGAKDAPGQPKSFHNLRKKTDDDMGQGDGLAPQAPLQDTEPLQGATDVKNADTPAPVDGTPSDSARPGGATDVQGLEKDTRNIQNAGLLYLLPLYHDTGTLKAVSAASSDTVDTGVFGSTSGGDSGGLSLSGGLAEKQVYGSTEAAPEDVVSKDGVTGGFHSGPAKGVNADASYGNAISVKSGNEVLAGAGQGSEKSAYGQGDGNDTGGVSPQAVKGLSLKSARHDMTAPGLLKNPDGTGADPSRVDVDKSAETVAATPAQGGSSDANGSGSPDDKGFERKGNSNIHSVKDGFAGNAAFTVDNLLEKTSFGTSKDIDIQAHNTAANNDVYDKLNSGINLAVTRGAKEVTISLHPEHLGAIHIKLNMEDPSGNAVSARITVDSMEVKGVLDADAGALKDAFNSQGLKLEGYTIELNKNAFGADGGDRPYSYGGGGGAGGFRDGPLHQGPGGWAGQNGEMKDNGQNVSRFQGAWYGAGGNSGVDLFV